MVGRLNHATDLLLPRLFGSLALLLLLLQGASLFRHLPPLSPTLPHFFADQIQNIVGNAHVFDRGAPDVDLGHLPETVAVLSDVFAYLKRKEYLF